VNPHPADPATAVTVNWLPNDSRAGIAAAHGDHYRLPRNLRATRVLAPFCQRRKTAAVVAAGRDR
jgi:hypothetical protein